MLSRFLLSPSTRSLVLRVLTLTSFSASSTSTPLRPPSRLLPHPLRSFSSSRPPSGGDGTWKFTPDADDSADSLFEATEEADLAGLAEEDHRQKTGPIPTDAAIVAGWEVESGDGHGERKGGDIFEEIDRELQAKKEGGDGDGWVTAEGFKPWGFGDEEEKGDLFGIEGDRGGGEMDGFGDAEADNEKAEETAKLELQEKELKAVLKGPDRAFGDLIAASGITDEMLDSLILLKDVSTVEGLPSLREIEDMYIDKSDVTSRFEEEKKKQQDIAKARVKQVDDKGRAYGTGRRKCSVARVFIQPGDGKFIINDREFDTYFPSLDHRSELLSPFMVTDTIGRWDVNCTVKGGGLSGQVGAIRLGISRALQNFEPGFREYLRPEGYLTRDPRVVERKKPGKAKARKSFQWVKR